MTAFAATTPGLYPLPDWAKTELADLKGHQKHDLIGGDESAELSAVYDEVRAELIDAQTSAGFETAVEGQARWDDMLAHPLAVHENVETRGIVRYFNNNNFYRDPAVVGPLTHDGDVAAELEAASEHHDAIQAVLPGPYTLAALATDEHYGDPATFLDAVADFLAEEVDAFPAHERLLLLEPSLVAEPPTGDRAAQASEAIDRVAGASGAPTTVHPYWGALTEEAHAHLLDADIDAVGYDFVSNVDDNLSNIAEFGTADSIALGLVDGQNTRVESVDTIVDRVGWIRDRLPSQDFDTIHVTANTELFYLPTAKFAEKLDVLTAAVDRLEEETEVTA